MRCCQARELMDRYVNEGLPPEEQDSFNVHLGDCQDCRNQLANFRRLLAALQSERSPPVPEAFVGRVMSRARREVEAASSSVGVWSALRVWRDRVVTVRVANAVTAVAAGLLIGLVLGEQTWQRTLGTSVVDRPSAQTAAPPMDSLDYLSGFSGSSFTETYLSLTHVASAQES